MKTAFSYVRFSSKPQEMGRSQARQQEATAAYCQRHDLQLSPHNYSDLGVSAWKGKNAHDGALAAFLHGVEIGRIPKGSVLIVESLDRVSRQTARKALRVLERIIEAGVEVVTLTPERRYDIKSLDDTFSLVEMLLIFVRANEESEIKSHRIKDAWRKRREKGLVTGGRGPGWLDFVDGEWKLNALKASTVRTIIQMSADGYGASAILHYLHSNKINNPASGRPKWSLAYVQLLMTDRRLIGELQPCEYIDGKGKPTGMPMPNYYPPAVDISLFARAQAASASRKRNTNTKIGNTINLFAGLMVDPDTGSKWVVGKKAVGMAPRIMLLSARNRECKSRSADYYEIEKSVLGYLADLDLETLLPRTAGIDDLAGKLQDVTQRIAAVSQQIEKEDPNDVQPLIALLVKLERERQRLAAAQNDNAAQQYAAGSAQGVIGRMQKATGEERRRLRLQLRTHLASVIKRIDIRIVPYWKWSLGVLDIVLVNGDVRREVTHKHVTPTDLRNRLLLEDQGASPALAELSKVAAVFGPANRIHRKNNGDVVATFKMF